MLRLFALLALGVGAITSLTIQQKTDLIWNNIERTPGNVNDQTIAELEIQNYFASNGYSTVDGIIIYYTFDFIWGSRYDDNSTVTSYIFGTWGESTQTSTLNAVDLAYIYSQMNTDTSNAVLRWEFNAYFQSLYGNCCTPPWRRR